MQRKKDIILTISLFSIPLASAQTTGGASVFAMLDGYVPMQISSGQDFLIELLIPFMIIFASTRFVVAGAANRALGKEKSSSRHSSGGMSGYMMKTGKSMSTWVAVATALTAVYQFGGIIRMVTFIFVGLGLAWALLQSFYFTTSSAISGGKDLISESSSDSSGGVTAQKVDEMIGNKIQPLQEAIEKVGREEEQEKDMEDQTEAEEEQGANPERIEGEIEQEEAGLMRIIEDLEYIEKELAETEDDIRRFEQAELQELRGEEQDLTQFEQFQSRVEDATETIIAQAQQGGTDQETAEEFAEIIVREIEYLSEFAGDLRREQEIHEAIQELMAALNALREVMPAAESKIQAAESLLEELEDEEQKAEVLAQKYGSKKVYQEINKDEQDTAQIEQELKNNVISKWQELKSRLDTEINNLKELRGYDQEEWKEIYRIVQELDAEEQNTGMLGRMNFGSSQFQQELADLKSEIDEIERIASEVANSR